MGCGKQIEIRAKTIDERPTDNDIKSKQSIAIDGCSGYIGPKELLARLVHGGEIGMRNRGRLGKTQAEKRRLRLRHEHDRDDINWGFVNIRAANGKTSNSEGGNK